MRILLTSILCYSGLMTHVLDVVKYLESQDIYVAVAYQKVNFLPNEEEKKLLAFLGKHRYCLYDTVEELATFTTSNNITLIHAHSYATFTMATAVSKVLNIPLVITLHSIFPWVLSYGNTLLSASKIIAVGPGQGRSAFPYGDKVKIISNGIDITKFIPNETKLESPPEVINILWYGRVDGRLSRGIRLLDRIAPSLPSHIKLSALGITDYRIRNMPHKKWTDNPVPYLQESHITFGHGRSLREAMACGSIGMLLGHGYGGIVTEEMLHKQNFAMDAFPEYHLGRPRSARIIQDIIDLSCRGKELNGMRKEARNIGEKYFDVRLMGSQIFEVYQETIKSNR